METRKLVRLWSTKEPPTKDFWRMETHLFKPSQSRIITRSDFKPSERNLKQLDETVNVRILQGRLIPISESLVHGGCTEFPVEQNEKIRPITDASGINPLYRPDPIVYPTIDEVLIDFDEEMVIAIDLSKAYHQMPIAWTDLQKFCIKQIFQYILLSRL